MGDEFPVAEGVRRVLHEITGERFPSKAAAMRWLREQKGAPA